MSVKVPVYTTPIGVTVYAQQYTPKIKDMFVEQIQVQKGTGVLAKWPTSKYQSDHMPLSHGLMQYPAEKTHEIFGE